MISKDGSYFFEVSVGEYVLRAVYYLDGSLVGYVEEDVNVLDDNDYIIDLVFDFNGQDVDYFWFVLIFVLILVVIFLIFWKKKPEKLFLKRRTMRLSRKFWSLLRAKMGGPLKKRLGRLYCCLRVKLV